MRGVAVGRCASKQSVHPKRTGSPDMGKETRSCPDCGAQNAADAKFCSQCATPLVTTQAQEIEALEAAAAAETEQATAEQPTAEVHGDGEPLRTETTENDELPA